MGRWSSLAVVVVAGCGRFGFASLDGDGGPDASGDAAIGDAPADAACSFGAWSTPALLSALNAVGGFDDLGADLSPDGLTIVFESGRPNGAGGYDIWHASRSAIGQPWSAPINLTTINTTAAESSPELSFDSLSLYFASDRGGPTQLYRATRAQLTQPFTAPALVPGLTSESAVMGIAISSDNFELLYTKFSMMTDIARATPVAGQFTPETLVAELNTASEDGFVSLTRDDLTIYFESNRSGGGDVYMASRPALGMPFATATIVTELVGAGNAQELSPEISNDGTEIIFASNRAGGQGALDLYVSTRSCQ